MTQEETDELVSGLEMTMRMFSDVLTMTFDEDSELALFTAANGQWIEAKAVVDGAEHYVCFTTSWGDQYCEQYVMPPLEPIVIDVDDWLIGIAPMLGGGWDTNVFN